MTLLHAADALLILLTIAGAVTAGRVAADHRSCRDFRRFCATLAFLLAVVTAMAGASMARLDDDPTGVWPPWVAAAAGLAIWLTFLVASRAHTPPCSAGR